MASDVAYARVDSPFGPLLVARTERGLVRVGLPSQDAEALLEDLAERVSPRVLEAPARLDEERRQLERYFEGRLDRFRVRVDLRLGDGFRLRVLRTIAAIPYGRTASYAEVAARAGNRRAVRAAGTACGRNPVPLVVPCHRVLRSSGALGNYGGGAEMKRALLRLEGALPA